MPDGTKPRSLYSGDLDDITMWLAEAPACLREAWEGLDAKSTAVERNMARTWLILDNLHGYFETMAEQWREEERQDRIDEERSLAMEQADWRASRGTR